MTDKMNSVSESPFDRIRNLPDVEAPPFASSNSVNTDRHTKSGQQSQSKSVRAKGGGSERMGCAESLHTCPHGQRNALTHSGRSSMNKSCDHCVQSSRRVASTRIVQTTWKYDTTQHHSLELDCCEPTHYHRPANSCYFSS
jgi:hypothetical protein